MGARVMVRGHRRRPTARVAALALGTLVAGLAAAGCGSSGIGGNTGEQGRKVTQAFNAVVNG